MASQHTAEATLNTTAKVMDIMINLADETREYPFRLGDTGHIICPPTLTNYVTRMLDEQGIPHNEILAPNGKDITIFYPEEYGVYKGEPTLIDHVKSILNLNAEEKALIEEAEHNLEMKYWNEDDAFERLKAVQNPNIEQVLNEFATNREMEKERESRPKSVTELINRFVSKDRTRNLVKEHELKTTEGVALGQIDTLEREYLQKALIGTEVKFAIQDDNDIVTTREDAQALRMALVGVRMELANQELSKRLRVENRERNQIETLMLKKQEFYCSPSEPSGYVNRDFNYIHFHNIAKEGKVPHFVLDKCVKDKAGKEIVLERQHCHERKGLAIGLRKARQMKNPIIMNENQFNRMPNEELAKRAKSLYGTVSLGEMARMSEVYKKLTRKIRHEISQDYDRALSNLQNDSTYFAMVKSCVDELEQEYVTEDKAQEMYENIYNKIATLENRDKIMDSIISTNPQEVLIDANSLESVIEEAEAEALRQDIEQELENQEQQYDFDYENEQPDYDPFDDAFDDPFQ